MFGSHQKQIRNTKKVKKGGTNKANLFQIFWSISGESGNVIEINSLKKLKPVVSAKELISKKEAINNIEKSIFLSSKKVRFLSISQIKLILFLIVPKTALDAKRRPIPATVLVASLLEVRLSKNDFRN